MKMDRSGKSSTRAWGKFQRMGVISRTYHVLGLLVAVRRYAILFLRPLPKVLPVHTIPRSPPPLLQSHKTGPPLRFRKNVASGVVLGQSVDEAHDAHWPPYISHRARMNMYVLEPHRSYHIIVQRSQEQVSDELSQGEPMATREVNHGPGRLCVPKTFVWTGERCFSDRFLRK